MLRIALPLFHSLFLTFENNSMHRIEKPQGAVYMSKMLKDRKTTFDAAFYEMVFGFAKKYLGLSVFFGLVFGRAKRSKKKSS